MDEGSVKRWNDMPPRWHEAYERGRPGYPAEVVDVAQLPSSATVLELGAGTGKLTRVLVTRFGRVIAVEPDDEMCRLLVKHCTEAKTVAGTAEQIPLPDASVDAVFAAECFHWFKHAQALVEIARVLRPRGSLVLMWNLPTGAAEPSIAEVEQLLEPYWPKDVEPLDLNPNRYAYARDWQLAFAQSPFEELQHVRLANPEIVRPEDLVAFYASMGWIDGLPDEERLRLLGEVRALLTADEYRLPWETDVRWTRLADP